MKRHRNLYESSIHLTFIVILILITNQVSGSPFPPPQQQPMHYNSWFFSGPQLFQQNIPQNQMPGFRSAGNSGSCHQMNIPCSGHTKDSCLRYCHQVGFPYGSCQGTCCLCSHSALLDPPKPHRNSSPLLPKEKISVGDDLHTAESRNPTQHQIHPNLIQNYWKNKNNAVKLNASNKNIPQKNVTQFKPSSSVCTTEVCAKAAKRLQFNMNLKAEPCTNFYEYACGGFVQRTQIPPDETEVTPFTSLRNKVSQQLRTLFEEEIHQTEPKPFKLAKTFYNSCMNTDLLNVLGTSPMTKVLDKFGAWPVLDPSPKFFSKDLFTWSNYAVWLRELGFSHDIFIKISVDPDIKNVKRRVITVGEPTLGISREVLISGLADPSVKAYYNYMIDTALLFGATSKPLVEQKMLQVLNFEIALAKRFHRPEGTRASAYYVPTTIAEMEAKHPSTPWLELFQRIVPVEINLNEVVIISAPHYLDAFFTLIDSVETETLANYAVWRLVSSSMAYLNTPARQLQLKFSAITTGQIQSLPRWKECTDIVASSMGNAVGAMYIRRYFPPSAKSEADEMIRNIHTAFLHILDEATWMDAATKSKAKEKALGMSVHVGYPDEHLRDETITGLYERYDFKEDDFFGNVQNLVVAANNLAFGKLKEPIGKNAWVTHGKNAAVNAFYLPLDNAIQFPAGILQNPFFDSRRPRFMNYGAVGWIAGHEVSHGFDDQGHQFDKDGNYANWWDPFTKSTYITKTKCIINQYGKFSPAGSGLKLNGVNSQGENIADNGGIKQAYRGYQSWVRKHGMESTIPGFQGFTPNQLFWISAASNWCSVHRPERLRNHILTGVHSPGEFRVKGTFANNKDFARDWNCKTGSAMNPVDKCEVW